MTTYEPADLAELLRDWSLAGCEHTLTLDQGRACSPCVRDRLLARFAVVDPASVVTLDPDDPNDVQRLKQALSRWESDRLTDLLRSLLPVVTPPEPNGLGAVVELANGNVWVRHADEWHHAKADITANWGDLRNVEAVKSHGVGCSCGAPDCNGGDR